MPEPVGMWWARRQVSRESAVPYAVGQYREAWVSYPVLVRQYHPEFNGGLTLSQIPPAADVFLSWQCDVGHVFVATPAEQRSRPGRERRRSSWCPECAELAKPRTPVMPMREVVRLPGEGPVAPALPEGPVAPALPERPAAALARPGRPSRSPTPPVRTGADTPAPAGGASARGRARARPRAERGICPKTPQLAAGQPFASACAPPPASAVEAQLRADLAARLHFEAGFTAVKLARPFFDHLEAWPDIVLSELRVAIEYDTTGRYGLEHVGKREDADRRKDRALRAAGWEVVRIRTSRLPLLGPHDIEASGPSTKTLDRLLDELRAIRGSLFVDAYLVG